MSLEHVDYFCNDTCLFCGNKAKEVLHRRDSYNACGCVGRNTWLKAKEALEESERVPNTRLKTLSLEVEVKRQRNALQMYIEGLNKEQEQLKCLLSNKD